MWIRRDSEVVRSIRIQGHCEKNCNKAYENETFRLGISAVGGFSSTLEPFLRSSLPQHTKNPVKILSCLKIFNNPTLINSCKLSPINSLINKTSILNGKKRQGNSNKIQKNYRLHTTYSEELNNQHYGNLSYQIIYRGGGNKNPQDETEINQGIRNLEEFIKEQKLELQVQNIKIDGNCLYRAIADQIDGDQESYQPFKIQAHEYIRENPSMFADICKNCCQETVDQYLKRAQKEGEWGCEIEIWALILALNIEVVLYNMTKTKDNKPDLKIGNISLPKEIQEKRNSSQEPRRTIHLGFVAGCHYVSVQKLDKQPEKDETLPKDENNEKDPNKQKVVSNHIVTKCNWTKAKIEETYPKEFIENFIESVGRDKLTFTKDGTIDWRTGKALFTEYLETLNKQKEINYQKEDSNLIQEEKHKIETEPSKPDLKRKNRPEEIPNTIQTQHTKLNTEENKPLETPIQINTANNNVHDETLLFNLVNQAGADLHNYLWGNIKPKLTKQFITNTLKESGKSFPNNESISHYLLSIITAIVLKLEIQEEEQKTNSSQQVEIKINELCEKEKEWKLDAKKLETENLNTLKTVDQVQVTLSNILTSQSELKEQNQFLKDKNTNLEKTCKQLEEKIEQLEQKITEVRESSRMEIEEYNQRLEQSFSEITTKDYFDIEGKFNELSIKFEDQKKKQDENIKHVKIKLEDQVKKQNDNLEATSSKVKELYNKASKKLENIKEKPDTKDLLKMTDIKSEFDKKIADINASLKKQIDAIKDKISSIQPVQISPSVEWDKIMEELKNVKQNCNDWDGKLLDITDTINTKLLPCIEKTSREVEGNTNRLNAFWKNRSKNKYLKGEEQRGVGINVEALERELSRKRNTSQDNHGFNFIPLNKESNILAEAYKNGKKCYLELKFQQEKEGFFREVYVDYKGYRKLARLYVSKSERNSEAFTPKTNSKQELGEESPRSNTN